MEKILCIRSDRFGEFLLTLPAIKLIKINYPQSQIFLLAQKENIELIKEVDFIDDYLIYEEKKYKGFFGALKLAKVFRRYNFKKAIIFNPKKEFHLSTFLANIPLRVGYDRKWGWCLNKKIADKKFLCLKHEVEYNVELAGLICKDKFIPEITLPVELPSSLDFIGLDKSKKFILLCPFSSNPSKMIENIFWEKLIEKIKNFNTHIAVIGAKEEEKEGLNIATKLNIYNFAGKLSLKNLATLLKYYCSVLIGVDSGPIHLCSMLKIPTVALFKTSNSFRWGPYKNKSLVVEGKNLGDFLEKIDLISSFICNL